MPPTPSPRPPRAWLAALALLGLLVLSAWWVFGDRGSVSTDVKASNVATNAADSRIAPEPTRPADPLERAAVDTPIPMLDAASAPDEPEVAPPPELADLVARDELVVRVVDALGAPIFDAAVTIRGLRKEGDEGSWYSRRDDATPVRTDREGRAKLPYERWTDIDGKTVRVDLVVEHPDFIPFNDGSFVLSPGEHVITLEQGSLVWVTVWTGARTRVIADARLELEWEAQLGDVAWRREPDGRLSTTKLPAGPHWITATHSSTELGALASDFTPFEVPKRGRVDLELELKPLITLRGKLDDAVPRPIVNGHVWINLHATASNLGLSSDHGAPVAPDGTFELRGLRRASGQAIALCDGWTSKLVPPRNWAEAGITPGAGTTEEELQAQFGDRLREGRFAQRIDATAGTLLVIEMEPAGELEVHVVDEAGAALDRVLITAWPNVYWEGISSTIFPGRDWNGMTDDHGIARISNLPVDSVMFGAQGATHQLRRPDRDQYPRARLESGKPTRYELVLERIP